MPVAKITRPGLTAIALSVALLWGFALGERVLMRQALQDRALVMRRLVRPRPVTEPVWLPSPLPHSRPRPNAG